MTAIGVCLPLSKPQMDRLSDGVGDLPLRVIAADEAQDCAIVFGNPSPTAVLANAGLQWLQLESVGFGEYAALDWSRPGGMVQVTNVAGLFSDPVAESALAGLLALCRGVDRLVRLQTDAHWIGGEIRPTLRLLRGARVVLFGYGAINRRLAELLAPFHCDIVPVARGWTDTSLDAALATADIVVATVPATPATADIFDAARLTRLRHGTVFCNFGRGSLVDEAALAAALRSGHLGGAVIDVTRDEPLPADHPFWTCPNLILTQHSGGGSADEIDRKIDIFLANLDRFRTGRPLDGLVDFARGY